MALKKYFFKLLGIENCKEKILLEEKFDENFNDSTLNIFVSSFAASA